MDILLAALLMAIILVGFCIGMYYLVVFASKKLKSEYMKILKDDYEDEKEKRVRR